METFLHSKSKKMKNNLCNVQLLNIFVFPKRILCRLFQTVTCGAVQTSVYFGRTDNSAQTDDEIFRQYMQFRVISHLLSSEAGQTYIFSRHDGFKKKN